MEDRIDQLEGARRRCLLGFLVAFIAWQAPFITQLALETSLPATWRIGLALLATAAGALWLVYGLRLWQLRRTIGQDAEAATALDDERVHAVRHRAFTFAFWAVLCYLAAVRVATFFTPLPAAVVTQAGLVVAAAAAISAFLYLDR